MNARTLTEAEAMEGADAQIAQLRVPPHSIEAESSVLGGLLLDNGAWDRVGDILAADDFYRREHRLIYEAMAKLINANKPADVITVYASLQALGKGDDAGGLAYLNSLAQYVPSAGNIRRYAEIVRERGILRKLVAASDEIATNAFNPQGRPVATILDDAMQQVMGISTDVVKDDWVSMDTLVVQQLDEIQAASDLGEDTRDPSFTPTGINGLDNLLDGGLRAGQFMVIGARPSMGKTSLADEIALHVALNESLPVAKFSMEMQNREGGQRAISSVGQIPGHALRRPKRMNDLHWSSLTRTVELLRRIPLYSNDTPGLNINQIRAKARALRRKVGRLGLVVVDYFQLMSGLDPRQNRNTQLEEASRGLKSLAKELGCPVIALAQVNRSVEKEGEAWKKQMPRMSDLKDCGSLEQDADIILMLIRPIVAQPGLADEWSAYARGHLAKQRGGRTGYIDLKFIGEHTRYTDWPLDEPVPESHVIVKSGGKAL